MSKIYRITGSLMAIWLLTSCAISPADRSEPVELTVAAASDLQFALTEISTLFEQQTGQDVTLVFGSTGQLAQQIEHGAPYDLLAAADLAYINDLASQNLVLPDSIALYARGQIVLAVNRSSGLTVNTLPDLLSSRITYIAIANPEHAPYGVAAKEAMQSAGVWDQVQPKVVLGENIRQTLQFIQTGDAQVGIIARSLADVPEVTWTPIDDTLYHPIDQTLAVVTNSPHQSLARQFAAFITAPLGQSILQKYGFFLPGDFPSTLAP